MKERLTPEEVQAAREALGLSVPDFAALLNVSGRQVYYMEERGASGPAVPLIRSLLRAAEGLEHVKGKPEEYTAWAAARRATKETT